MLDALLKETIVYVAGKQAEELGTLLNVKNHLNEFVIAKKMKLTINQTRNLLYKISGYGLLSSIRKKDKKKGWYTYFWKIEILKSLEFLKQLLLKQIEHSENQIKGREMKRFYVCERCNIELTEETALLHNFACDECGDIFKLKDNSKMLRELKRNLEKLTKKIVFVDKEIEKEQEKLEKIKIKELQKIEAEKEIQKKKKALERKKLVKKKQKEKKSGKKIKKRPLKKKHPKKKRKKSRKKFKKKR